MRVIRSKIASLLVLGELAALDGAVGGRLQVAAAALQRGLVVVDADDLGPLRAKTSTMPAPMVPIPTTPTLFTVTAISLASLPHIAAHRSRVTQAGSVADCFRGPDTRSEQPCPRTASPP